MHRFTEACVDRGVCQRGVGNGPVHELRSYSEALCIRGDAVSMLVHLSAKQNRSTCLHNVLLGPVV